jgi:hypothetical protein
MNSQSNNTWRFFLLCLLVSSLCSLCLCGEISAAEPYRLQVVLDFADNRALTKLFKDQVQRELSDNLRAAFGKLVKVEVVRTHLGLKEIEAKGLQQALDGPAWKAVSDTKTHFVLIDFVNGKYEIQARQHDGLSGQSGPIVRKASTRERPFVARTIGLVLDRDFGPVGTVPDKEENGALEVSLTGGAALDRWVKKGDVFALVQIVQSGGQQRAVRVPWALLQAQEAPHEGAVKCHLFHRHPTPLKREPNFVEFRCVKLATITAPVRLRLVKARAQLPTPEPGLIVHIRRHGFEGEDGARVEGAIDPDGFFQTDRAKPYENVAFVTVVNKDLKVAARIPVALVDERTVVVALSLKNDAAAQLQVRFDFWLHQLYEGLQANSALFKELNELAVKPGQRVAAMDKAKAALTIMNKDLENLAKMIEDLKNEPGLQSPSAKPKLAEGMERLKMLGNDRDELLKFIDGQAEVLAQEKDPARQKLLALVEQARGLEGQAEFRKALALYEQALKDGLKDQAVVKRRDELAKRLKPKDDDHDKAQTFLYETWPKFDAVKMKERVGQARKAFETCRAAGDRLTPLKLLKTAVGHVGKLKQQQNVLKPDVNEEDRKPAQELADVLEALGQLIADVTKYLEEKEPDKK